MRILIHDYGGYAFPVQLSRALAERGHIVLHVFASNMAQKGRLWKESSDSDNLSVRPLDAGRPYEKYNLRKRRGFERAYGRVAIGAIDEFRPDIVFNANCPLEPTAIIQRHCRRLGVKYIHWMQDIHAVAIRAILPKKIPVLGALIAEYYTWIERRIVAEADATIVIAKEFEGQLTKLGMKSRRIEVIPNWMPLDEMKPDKKINPWSIKHGLDATTNIIYFGTLSFKHDEELYLKLAERFRGNSNQRVVVIGGGIVMDRLDALKSERGLENLVLLGWQDYRDVASILATADVLLAAVTAEASLFSVPCKVLSYLSAGRAILAAIPPANLVAQILIQNDMGVVVDPGDIEAVVAAADHLISDPQLQAALAERGLGYARHTFEIGPITERFEALISEMLS